MTLNPLQAFNMTWEHFFFECFTKFPVNSKGTINHISKEFAFPHLLSTCLYLSIVFPFLSFSDLPKQQLKTEGEINQIHWLKIYTYSHQILIWH